MRIGILINSLSAGGAERVVTYLLNYCIDNNIEVHLFLMNTTKKYNLPGGLNMHFIEKARNDESGILKALKIPYLAFKYARLVKRLGITHSLSFLTRSNFVNILSRKFTAYKYKIITNERAFPSQQYSYGGLDSTFNKFLISKLYKKSDLLLGNSNGNVNDLIENFGMPTDRTQVVHNPIDLDKIESISPLDSFFDNSNFNLITIGRLDTGKNHLMLIKALHEISNPSVKLYIFGEGYMREKIEALIAELNMENRVILMGYESNPFTYLKAADLFIFGSNHEGFPNVLLEAMACDLPILTTNCQSGPNEIMELETPLDALMITNYGILVPVKNEALMAEGINFFVNDSVYLNECKKNVKRRIRDFEKNKILQQYFNSVNNVD
ncbi:glycosyltransferase [Winogradskyella sp.]|uniref:glycosyltransferase n=1 Tax=Winogradskyella sp. TaxID=1883156 RepID=UPI00262685B9|nr:glycosyltransferase [Winogradskyella sp.]